MLHWSGKIESLNVNKIMCFDKNFIQTYLLGKNASLPKHRYNRAIHEKMFSALSILQTERTLITDIGEEKTNIIFYCTVLKREWERLSTVVSRYSQHYVPCHLHQAGERRTSNRPFL
ncbi:hypothetical protein FQA47_007040 [Oryzias melastigma]|uniref:Uncharacterized protein n=1 Tax=Oryzias melastigma TaxID=30732 RepID=A0A834F8B4_ORYME|nr:hypothetical protein FQA47_007040 [Oryzias melastigma]